MAIVYSNLLEQEEAAKGLTAETVLANTRTQLASDEMMRSEHDAIEEYAKSQGREIVRLLIQDHFTMRGLALANVPVLGRDGRERSHLRLGTHRRLITSVGEVEVPRASYAGRGLSSLHPVDADLNLPADDYSFPVRKSIAHLAAEMSFERAGQEFERSTGVHVALRQVEELTRRSACDMGAFYETRPPRDASLTSELLVMSVDQKGIVMRAEHLREATRQRAAETEPKLESRLTRGEKSNRKRMATVAAVYTISPHERTHKDVVDGLRGIRRLEPSALKPPKPEYNDEAERRDPLRTKRWFVLIDGDPKLKKAISAEARRRRCAPTIVLDFIHALEYLWKAGHALFAEGSKELENWVLMRLSWILRGKSSDVAAGMRRSATKRGLSTSERKPIDEAARYFIKRRKMMGYKEALAVGTPISSGVIEGTCRSLINDRFDITGARWSVAGAEAVLKLRSIFRSGDAVDYWKYHFEREQERNHKARYLNGRIPQLVNPCVKPSLKVVK